MNKHAIVILYSGTDRNPGYDVIESIQDVLVHCGLATSELIEIKHFDSDSIAKAIVAKSVDTSERDKPIPADSIQVSINCGPTKLQVVKFIKEFLNLTLKEAKDMADAGLVTITRRDIVPFARGLYAHGGIILRVPDGMAIEQSCIYLNERYKTEQCTSINDFHVKLLKDLVDCVDKTDDFSIALKNAVSIIGSAPYSQSSQYMSQEVWEVINIGYRVLSNLS